MSDPVFRAGMIGRAPVIRVSVKFGPFAVVPENAWKQCKQAMNAAMEMYGFKGAIVEEAGEDEAFRRWYKWCREMDGDE